VAAPAFAQSSATLQGCVFDASGAVLPDATISVRNHSTGFDRSVPADAEGEILLASYPPGPYVVTGNGDRLQIRSHRRVDGILGHIFGSKDVSRQVASRASAQTGISESVLKGMLPVVAAMAMGAMSKRMAAAPTPATGARPAGDLLSMLTPDARRRPRRFNRR
jgi:Carboxypeptidase regulatory-like domain/Bacterial protein of unknown function (DUF937)